MYIYIYIHKYIMINKYEFVDIDTDVFMSSVSLGQIVCLQAALLPCLLESREA